MNESRGDVAGPDQLATEYLEPGRTDLLVGLQVVPLSPIDPRLDHHHLLVSRERRHPLQTSPHMGTE